MKVVAALDFPRVVDARQKDDQGVLGPHVREQAVRFLLAVCVVLMASCS